MRKKRRENSPNQLIEWHIDFDDKEVEWNEQKKYLKFDEAKKDNSATVCTGPKESGQKFQLQQLKLLQTLQSQDSPSFLWIASY